MPPPPRNKALFINNHSHDNTPPRFVCRPQLWIELLGFVNNDGCLIGRFMESTKDGEMASLGRFVFGDFSHFFFTNPRKFVWGEMIFPIWEAYLSNG